MKSSYLIIGLIALAVLYMLFEQKQTAAALAAQRQANSPGGIVNSLLGVIGKQTRNSGSSSGKGGGSGGGMGNGVSNSPNNANDDY